MRITDDVLETIDHELASREPEHGGLLIGAEAQSFIAQIICDRSERPAALAWSIDDYLTARLAELEQLASWLRLVGVIHTHPAGIDKPSQQDLNAAADLLKRNPALGRVVIPIVTRWCDLPGDAADHLADHEIALGNGKVSFFTMFRGTPGAERAVSAVHPQVVPVRRDANALAAAADGELISIGTTELDGVTHSQAIITTGTGMTLRLLVPAGYPVAAPVVLVGDPDDDHAYPQPVTWDLTVSAQERLVTALDLTTDNHTAERRTDDAVGDASPRNSSQPPADAHDLTARVRAPLGGSIGDLGVVVVGLGSVGSTIADTLVRSGVDRITLVDPDTVDGTNLSRSPYLRADIGRRKADALAGHLRAINPHVGVTPLADDITAYSAGQLKALLDPASLVVAATDAPAAQAVVNAAAFATNCPAVYIGLYARAAAGEVILTVPGVTRCYRCAAPTRRHQPDRPDSDYGTGRLNGEPALGCDITRVTMIGARFALALLAQQTGADTALTRHLTSALGRGDQFLITATEPDWGMFAGLLADVPGQNGFGTAWLSVDANPDCAICGEQPLELGQLVDQRTDRDAIARAIAANDPADREDDDAHRQDKVAPLPSGRTGSNSDGREQDSDGRKLPGEETLGRLIRFPWTRSS